MTAATVMLSVLVGAAVALMWILLTSAPDDDDDYTGGW